MLRFGLVDLLIKPLFYGLFVIGLFALTLGLIVLVMEHPVVLLVWATWFVGAIAIAVGDL